MTTQIKKNIERVQAALRVRGLELHIKEFSVSTRTAEEAATAIGCSVEQIAKSLIFKGKTSQKPILIIASGPNRVNEKAMKEIMGEKLDKADADFVLAKTGFTIGGIPPLGHKSPITTYIDQDLLKYDEIWAAAGTSNSVFKLTPQSLVEITGGMILSVT